MNCTGCGARLKVTHSYGVEQTAGTIRTARAVCKPCDKEFVATTVTMVEEAKHGEGAYAKARAIERGEVLPRITTCES